MGFKEIEERADKIVMLLRLIRERAADDHFLGAVGRALEKELDPKAHAARVESLIWLH